MFHLVVLEEEFADNLLKCVPGKCFLNFDDLLNC